MIWPDVREWLVVAIAAGAIPVLILAGLVIRQKLRLPRAFGWSLWFAWSLGLWLICIPGTQRTNDPSGEGIVIQFLLRYGPFLGVIWLATQHWVGRHHRRRERGFEVVERSPREPMV